MRRSRNRKTNKGGASLSVVPLSHKENIMGNLDMEWVKSQLEQAKVRKVVGDSVIKLIDLIESFDKLSEDNRAKVVEIFSKLSLGHAYIVDNSQETWVSAQPGQIKVADQVRVKADAFTGPLGTTHNGRRGVVVAVRYGDVIIKTNDGKQPVLDGAHYPPQKLEKMVKI
jgi:hypothetical protein